MFCFQGHCPPTRSKHLASVVSGLDFTRAVRMEPHLPDLLPPGDTRIRLHFPSQHESFALFFLSYMLHPQEDLSALLWTSGPGFWLQMKLHFKHFMWMRVSPVLRGASEKACPQSWSVRICFSGFCQRTIWHSFLCDKSECSVLKV